MVKVKWKALFPYAGLPVIGVTLLMIRGDQLDGLALLWCGMLLVFGYIATVTDIKAMRIPNELILAMIGAWVITMIPKLLWDTNTAIILLQDSVVGFAVGGGIFLLMYMISRKGLGGGDVKFMASAGLYLGYIDVFSVMLYGSVLAAIAGIVLLLFKKIGRKDSIPLAPFLYIGILITILYR